jgi:hypothetical protein
MYISISIFNQVRLTIYVCSMSFSIRSFNKKNFVFKGGVTQFSKYDIKQLKLNNVGFFSTTCADEAQKISLLIANHPGLSEETLGRKPIITDACACCGGNFISFAFCNRFQHANAVEVNPAHGTILIQNIQYTQTVRITDSSMRVFCHSYLKHMSTLKQDVVFLDAPWGGPGYSKMDTVSLYLGSCHIAVIVSELFKNAVATGTKYVVLKVPLNWNVLEMRNMLSKTHEDFLEKNIVLMHNFKKYNIYIVNFPVVSHGIS